MIGLTLDNFVKTLGGDIEASLPKNPVPVNRPEPVYPSVPDLPKLTTKSELADYYGVSKSTIERRLKAQGYETRMRKTKEGLKERGYQTSREKFQNVIKGLEPAAIKKYNKEVEEYTKAQIEAQYNAINVSYTEFADVFGYYNLSEIYDDDEELFHLAMNIYHSGKVSANLNEVLSNLSGRYLRDFEVNIPKFL